jgi:hypothetical protein
VLYTTCATNAYCHDANYTALLSIKASTCSGSVSQSFGYNAVGDRTSLTAGSTTSTYGYNQEHELTSFTKTGGMRALRVWLQLSVITVVRSSFGEPARADRGGPDHAERHHHRVPDPHARRQFLGNHGWA